MHFHVRDGRTVENLMVPAQTFGLKSIAERLHSRFQFGKPFLFIENIQIPHESQGGFGVEIFEAQPFQRQEAKAFFGKIIADFLPRIKLLNIRMDAGAVGFFPGGERFRVRRGGKVFQGPIGDGGEGMLLRKEKQILPFRVLRFFGQRGSAGNLYPVPDQSQKIFAGVRKLLFIHDFFPFRRAFPDFRSFRPGYAESGRQCPMRRGGASR